VTATVSEPPPAELPSWVGERSTSPRRRLANGVASTWMAGSVIVALIPLGFIAFYVIAKGISVISWAFLTKNIPIISDSPSGGIAPAIAGTLMLTLVAAVLAVPLGVLAAIYLNEYGGQRPTARLIRFMADVMTGVPSIVMGLFVAMIWVSAGLHRGYSTLAGALALACLMLPIVIRSSEEMLRLVPTELRQASDALGARRWVTVTRPRSPASSAARCSRSPAPPERPRRCCSLSASHESSVLSSTPRTRRCRSRSGTTRKSRYAPRRTARGVRRSR
jgi:phosphate transport system permease protein